MAKTTKKPAGKAPTKHDPKALPVVVGTDGKVDRALADLACGGIASNAYTVQTFGAGTFGQLNLGECIESIHDRAKLVHGGDLKQAETMLTAQASALNGIFGELTRRSALNMGEYLDASERYMRLALKAQAQCRATLETLAAIKNPPVVFARQANINNGGQQQVNNGAQPAQQAAQAPQKGGVKGEGASQTLEPPAALTAPDPTQGFFPPCDST